MPTTDYQALLQRLPASIYTLTDGTTLQKFWSLFADQLAIIDATLEQIRLVIDIDEAAGLILDEIPGGLLREGRGDLNDTDYKAALELAIFRDVASGTINELNIIAFAVLGSRFLRVNEPYVVGSAKEWDESWEWDDTNDWDGLPARSGNCEIVVEYFVLRGGFDKGFDAGFQKQDADTIAFLALRDLMEDDRWRAGGQNVRVLLEINPASLV